MSLIRSAHSGDYSDNDILKMYNRYVQEYEAQRLSCLSAMVVDINCETNQVTTVHNFRQAWPIKEKKIINPAAAKVREERLARKPGIKITPMPQNMGGVQVWDYLGAEVPAALHPNEVQF